jgi:hypothetical protein
MAVHLCPGPLWAEDPAALRQRVRTARDCEHVVFMDKNYVRIKEGLRFEDNKARVKVTAEGAIAGLGPACASVSASSCPAGTGGTVFRGDMMAGAQLSIGTDPMETGPEVAEDISKLLQHIRYSQDIGEERYFKPLTELSPEGSSEDYICFDLAKKAIICEGYMVRMMDLSTGSKVFN